MMRRNAVAVHYLVEGPADGQPVVLSGSLGSDLRMWDPQVPALIDAGYRVIRYDHRGHGASPVPPGPYSLADLGVDVCLLLDELSVRRAHFVGLSLGGMVGMWLAEHAANRLRSLTLCCTSAQLGPASSWVERAKVVTDEGTQAVSEAVVRRWFTESWHAAHPDRIRHYRNMVAATPAAGYASCCAAIATMTIADDLAHITTPTMVICGADDPATPPSHGQRIAAVIPEARLEIVGPAAHLASAEQPAAINDLILQHLKETR